MKNRNRCLLLSLILLLMLALAFTVNSQSEEMNLQKVTENLYMISNPIAGNVAFLVTEEGVLCVDAKYFPYQGEKVVEIIRQITDRPIKYLVYTHYHGDHTQGAQSFPGSTVIIAHQNTLKQMQQEGAARIEKDIAVYFPRQVTDLEEKAAKLKAEQSPELEETEKELELRRFQIKDYQRLKLVLPEITFEEQAFIYLGGHKVELIFLGEGHTEGDILVYFPDEKAIEMGDLLGYPGEEEERTRSLDVFKRLEKMEPAQKENILLGIENHIRTLEKAVTLDFEKAIPGHGKLTDKRGAINHLAFSRKLLNELKKVGRSGS